MHHITFETPIGELLIVSNGEALTHVAFVDENHAMCTHNSHAGEVEVLSQAKQQLREYFAGSRMYFVVPLCWDCQDVSEFHARVQRYLLSIPFGESRTYHDIAVELGAPTAVRDVDSACARNPLPIFAPCHRVIRSEKVLGSYRGGIDTKEWLLDLESA